MKKILFVAAISAFFLFKTNNANAQVSKNHDVNVKIAAITDLVITNGTLATFDFTTISELENGITQTSAVNLAYKSNKVSKISIEAAAANFTSATSSTPMPSSVIQFRKAGGTFAPLTGTTPIDFSTNQARGVANFNMDYKIIPGLNYDPATDYTINLVYTLTAP